MQPNAHKDLREIWLSPSRGAAEAAMTIFAGEIRAQIRQGRRMPDQGSADTVDVLRLSHRSLGPLANLEPDRERVRDGEASYRPHERRAVAGHRASHARSRLERAPWGVDGGLSQPDARDKPKSHHGAPSWRCGPSRPGKPFEVSVVARMRAPERERARLRRRRRTSTRRNVGCAMPRRRSISNAIDSSASPAVDAGGTFVATLIEVHGARTHRSSPSARRVPEASMTGARRSTGIGRRRNGCLASKSRRMACESKVQQ
jgi:hypothetical protein